MYVDMHAVRQILSNVLTKHARMDCVQHSIEWLLAYAVLHAMGVFRACNMRHDFCACVSWCCCVIRFVVTHCCSMGVMIFKTHVCLHGFNFRDDVNTQCDVKYCIQHIIQHVNQNDGWHEHTTNLFTLALITLTNHQTSYTAQSYKLNHVMRCNNYCVFMCGWCVPCLSWCIVFCLMCFMMFINCVNCCIHVCFDLCGRS